MSCENYSPKRYRQLKETAVPVLNIDCEKQKINEFSCSIVNDETVQSMAHNDNINVDNFIIKEESDSLLQSHRQVQKDIYVH